MSGAGRPAKKYRVERDPYFATEPSDILDTAITRGDVFWATTRRYAELHGIDHEHLCTALRLSGVPGAPVTARLVWDCAAALAAAGYQSRVPCNDVADHFRRASAVARAYSCGAR